MATIQLALFRVCTVDGCCKQSYVPGSGKGMCGPHYQKWARYGDPLADHRRQRQTCSVDGCTKWCVTEGVCGTHAWRLRTHGSVTPRLQGQVVDGKRICPACHEDKPLVEYGQDSHKPSGIQTYCKECAKAKVRARRIERPDPRRPSIDVACRTCGANFAGHKQRAFCSRACQRIGKIEQDRAYEWDPAKRAETQRRWYDKNPDKIWAKSVAYRARKKTATVESVDRAVVLNRDGWRCQICAAAIDPSLDHPDPMSASIDHRIPLAGGGEHSMANCQAAHLICNVRKGAKVAA